MSEVPPDRAAPPSPVSEMLDKLGLTRHELEEHAKELRAFLDSKSSDRPGALLRGELSRDRLARPSSSLPKSRSGSVLNASRYSHTPPPPMTPVKREPVDATIPHHRTKDIMEMVIERKNQQLRREKRLRKERQRSHAASPSPSPALPSMNLDSFMHSRDSRRVNSSDPSTSASGASAQAPQIPPETPQHLRYYREVVEPALTRNQRAFSERATSPLPGQSKAQTPVTPGNNEYYRNRATISSSTPQGEQASSSPQGIANRVSSPGPLGPASSEPDYAALPFELPPGPYTCEKPTYSYAALIGQAILASPGHRLTLQEIYEYITIVYPYFKRGSGEQTWMNSIRHVLSTTAVFRKVSRDERAESEREFERARGSKGRTLWAIYDEDIECFRHGSFDKRLCKDMMGEQANKKKRPAEDAPPKKIKKPKKASTSTAKSSAPASDESSYSHAAPLFPPLPSSDPHRQPYHLAAINYIPQVYPAEVIFPPIPGQSRYRKLPSSASARSTSRSPSPALTNLDEDRSLSPPPPSTASSSFLSIPELTPNQSGSSSSSPPLQDAESPSPKGRFVPAVFDDPETDKDDTQSSTDASLYDALSLYTRDGEDDDDEDVIRRPSSSSSSSCRFDFNARKDGHLFTPPQSFSASLGLPETPPPLGFMSSMLSPERTPISHKGLHMSPTFNLSHYKTHLNPPPPSPLGESSRQVRTPSPKPRLNFSYADSPFKGFKTPDKYFKYSSSSSPHSTAPRRTIPASVMLGDSPLRQSLQNMKRIFDTSDASTVLQEEVARIGEQSLSDSPTGLYGKEEMALLYRSPGEDSTGRRWSQRSPW